MSKVVVANIVTLRRASEITGIPFGALYQRYHKGKLESAHLATTEEVITMIQTGELKCVPPAGVIVIERSELNMLKSTSKRGYIACETGKEDTIVYRFDTARERDEWIAQDPSRRSAVHSGSAIYQWARREHRRGRLFPMRQLSPRRRRQSGFHWYAREGNIIYRFEDEAARDKWVQDVPARRVKLHSTDPLVQAARYRAQIGGWPVAIETERRKRAR